MNSEKERRKVFNNMIRKEFKDMYPLTSNTKRKPVKNNIDKITKYELIRIIKKSVNINLIIKYDKHIIEEAKKSDKFNKDEFYDYFVDSVINNALDTFNYKFKLKNHNEKDYIVLLFNNRKNSVLLFEYKNNVVINTIIKEFDKNEYTNIKYEVRYNIENKINKKLSNYENDKFLIDLLLDDIYIPDISIY